MVLSVLDFDSFSSTWTMLFSDYFAWKQGTFLSSFLHFCILRSTWMVDLDPFCAFPVQSPFFP